MRTQLIVFVVLLALGVTAALLYPSICLSVGRRAMEQGDTERAVRYLTKAGSEDEVQSLLNASREQQAEALLAEERYAEALAILTDLPGIEPDDARILACRYGLAASAERRGAYAEARDGYAALLGYADAADRLLLCEIALANAAWTDGDTETALALIGKYPQDPSMAALYREIRLNDARTLLASDTPEAGLSLLIQLWNEDASLTEEVIAAERSLYPYLYADRDDDYVLEQLRLLSAAQAARKNELERIREQFPSQVLAVGTAHTAALRADGTVLAAGDNTYGQCNVSEWTDIVAIAAGAYHTVGLKADGSVVCTGDNSRGQCDADGCTGAVEIEAHAMDTVVRLSDGSIVCFGAHDDTPGAASWTDIVQLSPAAYGLVALSADGTAMATEASLLTPAFRGLTEISAAGDYAVGVTEDGGLVTSAPYDPGFTDVIHAEAAATGFFVLTTDGSVRAVLWTDGDYAPLLARTDIAAIAFSGTHAVALLSDGSYLACGQNDCNQCEVGDWRR
ncbi:MAG: tetratricopeptide repeat protein [Clostridia bacterium]|nr:tetratricopeptide repeat protein [Clostridia bacterium]